MDKLRKIRITSGVYWVEALEAGAHILCGAPPDVVKHLMKHGLILPTEAGGVQFETGPNAILLSDVQIQNGMFSNMAEFPVSQMLYRQGMALPGHPNNKGQKPIIVGSREQVFSQMQYIHRGNYGLLSGDEMIHAGESAESADMMMKMKLAFAFGEIQSPWEFLETRIIEDEPIEIVGGVFVKRTGLNVFEFSYDGWSVSVDLNLSPGEHFLSPYPLGSYSLKREYFAVVHSGEGDGWDVGRPSMSSVLMFQGKIYLIDAGPNIEYILSALGIGISEVEGIFHTHSHDDHFAGLTTLMRADHRIKHYATPLVRASVSKKLSVLLSIDEDAFDHYFEVKDLKLGEWNDIDGLEVKPVLSPHPVETTVFKFRALCEDGYKSYAHFADIVSMKRLKEMVRGDAAEPGVSRELYNRVESEYMEFFDIKKVDIGGGLIHGDAEDFSDDRSSEIVFAHTALPLTDRQKEIGSGSTFGTVESLAPVYKDYAWQFAHRYLKSHFNSVPEHQVQVLLNTGIAVLNPETIILKEGEIARSVYLVLTGTVEGINSKLRVINALEAGTFIGEASCLDDAPSEKTYRTASFIQALKIPSSLYKQFVLRNDLEAEISRLRDNRKALLRTPLFGEGLSYDVQNNVARSMRTVTYCAGEELAGREGNMLKLVKKGRLELYLGEDTLETLGPGDSFGEETSIFASPMFFGIRALEPVELYEIPESTVRAIPAVMWKLFETFERRKKLIFSKETGQRVFHWRGELATDVPLIDEHHKMLFKMCANLIDGFSKNYEKSRKAELRRSIEFLVNYTKFHFGAEEELFRKSGYPEADAHSRRHKALVDALLDKKKALEESDYSTDVNFVEFLEKNWIVDHILTEDSKFGKFARESIYG